MATIMHCHSASLSHPPFLSASLTPLSRSSRRLPGGFYYNSSNLFGDANIRFSHRPNRTIKRRTHLTVVGLFGLGVPELVVIAGVAALVFGPKKLPEIGKSLGKTVKSFQQAANEFQEELSGAKESKASETMKAVDNSTTKEKERAEVPADD